MLQTPGSLKNRDVSLTAFSPRGLGAFGEIIDESPGMQRENERHTQRLAAAQSLAPSLVCTSVCTSKQQTGRECAYVYAHVCVCLCACVDVSACV